MREADGSRERGGLGPGHETGDDQVLDEVPEARVDPHLGKEHQRDRHQEPDVGVDAGEERAGLARAGSDALQHDQEQQGQPREKRQRDTEPDRADRPPADPGPSDQAMERAALDQRKLRQRRIDGLPGGGHHRVIIERGSLRRRVGQCCDASESARSRPSSCSNSAISPGLTRYASKPAARHASRMSAPA